MKNLLISRKNGKFIESSLLILLGVVVAFTLVLSFSVIDFNSNVTAHAAAPSDNQIYMYPGSTSLVANGYDYSATPLFYFDGTDYFWNSVDVPLNLTLDTLNYDSDLLFQYIFYIETLEGDVLYLDGINWYDSSPFGVVGDHGYSDNYFVFSLSPYSIGDNDLVYMGVDYYQDFEDMSLSSRLSYAYVYDIRLINSTSSSGVNIDQIADIMFDGVSFSANAISTSISYTFENLFLNEDGTLTVYTQLILWFAGIGLLLSFVRMLTDWLFSLGGNKDKL